MILREWNWRTSPTEQQHSERVALIREIVYEMTNLIGESEIMYPEHDGGRSGKALSLNISSGGGSATIPRVVPSAAAQKFV